MWRGMLFYVPAFVGGICGLLGGYLTDLLGRRRVLTWSILLYAFSAFAAGFSTSPMMLLIFRTTTFVGVCVEFVAAVAWLAELFPNPASAREGARLHSGVFVHRRLAGRQRQFPGRPHWKPDSAVHDSRIPGRHARSDRGGAGHLDLALHAHVGADPRHPSDADPAFSSGKPGLGQEEGRGNLAASELAGSFFTGAAPHHGRHDDHVRLQLRSRVRRDSADAADRARIERRREGLQGEDLRQGAAATARRETHNRSRTSTDWTRRTWARSPRKRSKRSPAITRRSRKSAAWSDASCWP